MHDRAPGIRRWVAAWVLLVVALGIHVLDEATTGFLPLYNAQVAALRADYPWLPLPSFTFRLWLTGLIGLVGLLLALTPLVARGARVMRFVSYALGVIMVGNALGHVAASVWLGTFAPGVHSSPLLLLAAATLLVAARSSRSGPTPR